LGRLVTDGRNERPVYLRYKIVDETQDTFRLSTTAGINAKIREQEDLSMYKRYWPGLIAKLFAKLYARSYKSNTDPKN
jgi:hypothetical protein